MKQFVQFYRPSTGYVAGSVPPRFDGPKELIEACGSDGVLPLDGRLGWARCATLAREIGKARGMAGFQIRRGARYSDGRPYPDSDVIKL